MNRWERRDRKRRKKIHGMRVVGRSILSVLLPTITKKAQPEGEEKCPLKRS